MNERKVENKASGRDLNYLKGNTEATSKGFSGTVSLKFKLHIGQLEHVLRSDARLNSVF